MVRARAAIPDEFSSVPIKTVPQVPVQLKLRSAKASRKTLGLEESSDTDFTDSEFTIIESESDSETAPENYYYPPGQYIFSPELNRVEDRSVVRSCSAFLWWILPLTRVEMPALLKSTRLWWANYMGLINTVCGQVLTVGMPRTTSDSSMIGLH